MSLHIKQRPLSFDDVVGEANAPAINSLKALFNRQKEDIPHAFLFTGPSGCGKTTLARIVAMELGCSEQDFIEMDSAQFRGIDTIRDLRRQAQLRPLDGDCRVYLLDECHQLSKDAQEALLKLLEDTPPHVWICLATTELQQLKPTLINRCNRFEVGLLELREMQRFIKNAAKVSNKPIGGNIAKAIAKGAEGSPRAGLTALELVMDLPEDEQLAAAEKLSTELETEVKQLCRALLGQKPWKTIRPILAGLKKEDAERVRRAVLGYADAVLMKSDNTIAAVLLESFETPTWEMGGWPAIDLACYRAFVELSS